MSNPDPKPPPKNTRWKPGQSGNPGGKPVGARDRITTAFLYALAEDFEKHGVKAIQETRKVDPAAYVKVCASLLPKQIEQTKPLDDLTDAELMAVVEYLRSRSAEAAGSGVTAPGEPSQTH